MKKITYLIVGFLALCTFLTACGGGGGGGGGDSSAASFSIYGTWSINILDEDLISGEDDRIGLEFTSDGKCYVLEGGAAFDEKWVPGTPFNDRRWYRITDSVTTYTFDGQTLTMEGESDHVEVVNANVFWYDGILFTRITGVTPIPITRAELDDIEKMFPKS